MKHPLNAVNRIKFHEPSKGFLTIQAIDGYSLSAILDNGMWKFTDASDKPSRSCHFTLRHQIHQALNPGKWKALADKIVA